MPAPVTLELAFERPTRSTVRFRHPEFGVLYVPNSVYAELGCPDRLTIILEPAAARQLAAV